MIVIIQYIKTSLPLNVEKDVHLSFTFQDSDGYIELVFDEEQQYPFNGWSIIPQSAPLGVCILVYVILITYNVLQISKHSIDRFVILYVY